jgi:hypothetical protein
MSFPSNTTTTSERMPANSPVRGLPVLECFSPHKDNFTLAGAKVRDRVMTTQFKRTIMGDVKYRPDGTAIFPAGVLQWWNGERKTVYPFNLSGGWKIKPALPWDQKYDRRPTNQTGR